METEAKVVFKRGKPAVDGGGGGGGGGGETFGSFLNTPFSPLFPYSHHGFFKVSLFSYSLNFSYLMYLCFKIFNLCMEFFKRSSKPLATEIYLIANCDGVRQV
jgi:hypothetical protein